MKKVVLTSLAVLGLAVGAFGQGAVQIDNNQAAGYLNLGAAHYDGVFGVELWYKNSSAATDTAINSLNGQNASSAYALLSANGFTLATHINPGAPGTTAVGGVVSGLGQVNIPGINRAANGGSALLAIAFWTGPGANSFLGGVNGGVLSFNNPTADYTAVPPPAAPGLDSWPVDLIMTPVPEPGTFALAGLGAAALLIFRRRK